MNVSLSPVAAAKFRELAQTSDQAAESVTIRLYVAGQGCCRATFGLSIATQVDPGDTTVKSHGIRLLIDERSRELGDGVSIDYLHAAGGEGFAVRGPRLRAGCSCQAS